MITEKEHKQIYSIIEKFGGDDKLSLRNNLLSLLNRHDAEIKKRLQRTIDEV